MRVGECLIYDTDFWHHLLVGKVIWQSHAIPDAQPLTWPAYGLPGRQQRVAVPRAGVAVVVRVGIAGLFVLALASTLAVFGILGRPRAAWGRAD